MEPGDLVKVKDCYSPAYGLQCDCFFCRGKSNRVGLITGTASHNSLRVIFDCGEWRIYNFEEARGNVEVISESR